jgi:MFS family permease
MPSQLLQVFWAGRFSLHSDQSRPNLTILRFLGGAFCGSLLQAWVSPRYGRRFTTAFAAILLTLCGALMAGSVDIEMFITFRVLSGVGAGILTSNCPTYISEISPSHSRGILTSLHGISINSAYVMSSLFAFGFNFVHHDYQWRLQFCIFTFASMLLLVSVFFLPESPRWLVVRHNPDFVRRE